MNHRPSHHGDPVARRRGARTRREADSRRPRTLASAAALLFAASTGAAAQQSPDELGRAADASRSRGAEDAPVVVYEVADFQCPYCARFSREVFPKLDSAYIQTGKVRWVFINYPVPSHPRAWAAAEAALCAGAVGNGFWAMHHRLYANQEEWSRAEDLSAAIARYASELDLPQDRFQACMRNDDVASTIIRDVMSASTARIQGTPTFFIDDERSIVGLHSFEDWTEILDQALANQEE